MKYLALVPFLAVLPGCEAMAQAAQAVGTPEAVETITAVAAQATDSPEVVDVITTIATNLPGVALGDPNSIINTIGTVLLLLLGKKGVEKVGERVLNSKISE